MNGEIDMSNELIIALIPFVGSVVGTLGGIILSSKLTTYRIGQLEKRVEEHNHVVERTYKLERKNAVYEEKFKDIDEKLNDLKEGR